MTDYKALCAELANHLQGRKDLECGWPGEDPEQDLLDRARTALAQPEPEGVTDEALANFSNWFCRNYPGPDTIIHKPEWHAPKVFRAAAYALTRYARPASEPVPVAERRPGPEDCDAEGRCWAWGDAYPWLDWKCWKPFPFRYVAVPPDVTHWLPHHALPVPGAEVQS